MLLGVLQARMGSRRLPGKTLADVAGRPLLWYVVDRIMNCTSVEGLVVATSTEPQDDPIAAFCVTANLRCFRGPQDDVAARLLGAARFGGAEVFARFCADSPCYDPAVIDRVVSEWSDELDVVTNVFPRSFPKGQSVELLRTSLLEREHQRMIDAQELENPFLYFYRRAESFRIANVAATTNCSASSLCVDTYEELESFRNFVTTSVKPLSAYGWAEALAVMEAMCSKK